VNLIDCSNAQGSINWVAVKNAGVQGAWLKATEGVTFNDSWYATNRRRANVIGLRTGAYHFARPENNSAVAEADHFSHVIGKPGRRDLKPVLDMEGKGDEAWAHAFCKRVRENLGVTTIFYSYSAWIKEHNFKTPVGNGLWLANYDGLLHTVTAPKPWKRYVAHQYTDKGIVPGVRGDCDRSWGRLIGCLAHPVLGAL
jgi:lysozyme